MGDAVVSDCRVVGGVSACFWVDWGVRTGFFGMWDRFATSGHGHIYPTAVWLFDSGCRIAFMGTVGTCRHCHR